MYVRINNDNSTSLFVEAEDLCKECRYSGQSNRISPCAFVYASKIGLIPSLPLEEESNTFYIEQCGAYAPLLKKVEDIKYEHGTE